MQIVDNKIMIDVEDMVIPTPGKGEIIDLEEIDIIRVDFLPLHLVEFNSIGRKRVDCHLTNVNFNILTSHISQDNRFLNIDETLFVSKKSLDNAKISLYLFEDILDIVESNNYIVQQKRIKEENFERFISYLRKNGVFLFNTDSKSKENFRKIYEKYYNDYMDEFPEKYLLYMAKGMI